MGDAREAEDALARVCASPGMRPLLRFAAPTMGMMLFLGLYTVCDAVFVARFAGTDALAALNIVCPVVQLTVGLGTMLAALALAYRRGMRMCRGDKTGGAR